MNATMMKMLINAVRNEERLSQAPVHYSPRLFAIVMLEHEYGITLPKHTKAQLVIDAMQGILDFNGIPA